MADHGQATMIDFGQFHILKYNDYGQPWSIPDMQTIKSFDHGQATMINFGQFHILK